MGGTLLEARARDARQKAAFYAGERDTHPHGASGSRWIVPPEDSKNMWDTSPRAIEFSEWGNAAGSVAPAGGAKGRR